MTLRRTLAVTAALAAGAASFLAPTLAAPAFAASSATVVGAPSEGGMDGFSFLSTSGGFGCAHGDNAEAFLAKELPAAPLTSQQVDDLVAGTDAGDEFGGTVFNIGSTPVASNDGELTAVDGYVFDPTTILDSSAHTHALTDVASAWGAAAGGTPYTITMVCLDSAHAPVLVDGAPLVAGSTLTIASDGSWKIGDTTPDASATTVTATQASPGGDISVSVTVGDTTTPATVPTGTIVLYDGDPVAGGTLIASDKVLVDGALSGFTVGFGSAAGSLAAGDHTIYAAYVPTAGLNIAASQGSADITVHDVAHPAKVSLKADASGTQVTLTATVQYADGTTATDATGTVDFAETTGSGWTQKAVAVSKGIATATETGLTTGTKYTFTGAYTAGAADSVLSSTDPGTVDATITGKTNTKLADGGTVTPGTTYDVSFDAATFANGDSVDVVLHSDPTDLGKVTANADGSLTFTLSSAVTSTLAAGSSHQLIFTGTTDSTKTQTINFAVPAATSTGSTQTGSNQVSTFLTDSTAWATTTPQGIGTLLGIAVLLAGAVVIAWNWFWRRRRAGQR